MATCKCEEKNKSLDKREWEVWKYKCNYSAFNGYHYTPSEYSTIYCKKCSSVWRTKAAYVEDLKHK